MESAGQQIFYFMSHYGYWIILPLMIIEGPVATIMAAMLASLGAFNVWVVLLLSMLGDIIGDVIFYAAGYYWGMDFVRRIGKYIGITENLILKMEKYFQRHGGKTIFTAKSTTGLCWATFTAAGIVKMNFIKFLKYSIMGGVVWSGFLVSMGYFYGYMWREIKQYIEWVGWLAVGLAFLTFVGISLFKKYKSKRLFVSE
ncbi:MAG: DedA family protein [Candidatus Moranbacteria bacterium GW2011_GWE1_35_17]|nr:MAG: DedA family protein [Candidatus Moranbacteria bacterium GW2011_GWE2_35_164]KKP68747.1 MAG: DedA family protein [Candidatus Moranbacteria bacterium GW2011_GWE1_35_17]KKP82938.1 MAG: DedA family protein [Candidatus Moranbacteria bacterium GW2011_GWF1_35_5]KKP83054.1 MAG: DedA family protein [Candidatus Moranbacteria bacterium GW2011_GWF2_35_54]